MRQKKTENYNESVRENGQKKRPAEAGRVIKNQYDPVCVKKKKEEKSEDIISGRGPSLKIPYTNSLKT